MARRRPKQLCLPIPPGWGGLRTGAGRKPNGRGPGVWHVSRPPHDQAHPVLVTLRADRGLRVPPIRKRLSGPEARARTIEPKHISRASLLGADRSCPPRRRGERAPVPCHEGFRASLDAAQKQSIGCRTIAVGSGPTVTMLARCERRARSARRWCMCYRTFGSICERRRSSIRVALDHGSTAGRVRSKSAPSRRQLARQAAGSQQSAGAAPAD